ncbi:hypothetical protein EJ05DRAFT_485418 [Pseudovirgaria hyperparasitica]|uniref:SAM and PH domain-containing protein n=1 Tax=Pseudovirgaria hyperparasitica TaxID=470096 RepID=A0A6A6WB38_9PEZI|nr:uncharacterized protein EJ05DRAFT_485418 [Pseudovirgaria hyperparasitica]KAF2759399.1 hypothetical protein EJ05DRAFT_485418 [Pseudovirgaria hyperparasitica]
MQAMTPITPLESGVEMFQKGQMQTLFPQRASGSTAFAQRQSRSSQPRPVSEATEIFDTDLEDDSTDLEDDDDDSSDFEEDSPKYSFDSSESRRSQTTLSSFEEITTPYSSRPVEFDFKPVDMKPVEGPRGPHLFRASQTSIDFDFDFALQLSPIALKSPMTLPPPPPQQEYPTERELLAAADTPATVIAPRQLTSLVSAMQDVDSSEVRSWSSMQVAMWMSDLGFDGSVVEKFKEHDITGAVLLDMQFEDLKELDIASFGKRHQLWNHIDALRENNGRISPAPTPFQDTTLPCSEHGRSKSRRRRDKSQEQHCGNGGDDDEILSPITPGGAANKKRRARKPRNINDIVTPAESVSIVAIEQLLPKPHKCAKGERCAKWRKQQRQLARLQEEHGFAISPENGGQIFIAGDPGNAGQAGRIVENVVLRPASENVASVVASSAALPSAQFPPLALHEEMLDFVEHRDPQENVKQFLSLQGWDSPDANFPVERPPTPPLDLFPPPAVVPLQPPVPATPHTNLKNLPKLSIPRAASALSATTTTTTTTTQDHLDPKTAFFSPCRSALSPADPGLAHLIYRFGTPASEMDVPVPVTALPSDPLSRDSSQSVPPNMLYRDPTQRSASRAAPDWRRPSFALPSLLEDRVFEEPASYQNNNHHNNAHHASSSSSSSLPTALPLDPKSAHDLKPPRSTPSSSRHHNPSSSSSLPSTTKPTATKSPYPGSTHAGWMKKRRTRLLRHEWTDAHFRLTGSSLAMHPNALPSSSALNTIDIDDYAVACSSVASGKLAARIRALRNASSSSFSSEGGSAGKGKAGGLDAAFEFQLVPAVEGEGGARWRRVWRDGAGIGGGSGLGGSGGSGGSGSGGGKTLHFAVETRDERIDWMRELMLAKALRAKGRGFEVEVNGRVI